MEYDANGNQLSITQVVNHQEEGSAIDGVVEQKEMKVRKNVWDEEDRLRAVDLNPEEENAHPVAVYTYDAAGQRIVRYIPGRVDVKSNANNVSQSERDEVILYPSALITVKALSDPRNAPRPGDLVSSYTKHYYIGAERVHSTLGTMRDLGLFPKTADWHNEGVIRHMADESVLEADTGLTHAYTLLEQNNTVNSSGQREGNIQGYIHDATLFDAYWYHSDHLGSSSYITNQDGLVTQHMEYLPFGETLVDEHINFV